MNIKPKSRKENIVIQELKKELLIYDLKTDKALSLNETCAMVWRECDGSKTIPEIASILNRETDGLVNEEVVWLALDTLRKENLLDESFKIDSIFNGMNRREVIRKIGFASMVAIPAITSLIAPTAANAQSGASGIALFGACPTGLGCNPGLTCKHCGQGSNCPSPSRLTCCSNSAVNTFGTGVFLVCGSTNCATLGSLNCCSGTSIVHPEPICGVGGVSCICG